MTKMPPTAISRTFDGTARMVINKKYYERQVFWVRSDGSLNCNDGHVWHEAIQRAIDWNIPEVLVTFVD